MRGGRIALRSIITVLSLASSMARGADDPAYTADAIVDGKSIGEWTVRWWEWAAAIPVNESPLLDPTGELCMFRQSGPVYLLPSSLLAETAPIFRCVVPCGKKILVPVVWFSAWAPGDCDPMSMDLCRATLDGVTRDVDRALCSVDGTEVPDILDDHRHQSPTFDLTVPDNNVFNLPPPLTRKWVSDGFWILLKPLPPGRHTIQSSAHHPGFNWGVATYELTVACDRFRRGDANADGNVDIADPIVILERLFRGGAALSCEDAADVQDDGSLDITDPIYALSWLFMAGPAPFPPGPRDCGPDPQSDQLAECSSGC